MPQGPSLIFDKSSLESLNLDEATLLDNFYRSSITPLFFVECLADLEKAIKSRSTPEQLVGSLAMRTPDAQSCAHAHHRRILGQELSGHLDLSQVLERPMVPHGEPVQLGDKRGIVFRRSPEEEALERWTRGEFLEVERCHAKVWRQAIMRINHDDLVKIITAGVGHWRKPKSLEDAKQIADTIIDNMDPEWLIGFGLELLDIPEATVYVRRTWTEKRKPPIRDYLPYLTLMLTINIFFSLVVQTPLLRNVKQSHQVDLAYLYYLPFCSVFTSKDHFHAQIAPLFMNERQTFVHGAELKEDLARLVNLYAALPENVQSTGLITFAPVPPDDTSFLVTRLWDIYLPSWRAFRHYQKTRSDPEEDEKLVEEINRWVDGAAGMASHNEHDVDKLDHVTLVRRVKARKGRWRRFSEEQEQRMWEYERSKMNKDG
jgi:hypothetical protein